MEVFVISLLFTLIFGTFSYMLLKHPEGVLKVSSFSHRFSEKPFLKKFLMFMGWWFLLLVIGVWIIFIVTLFK
ncbi:hypothetical protein [Cytobacillus praedii]|uniref:hypothetical protein n=1 Tax=Cytobacillus praedii TaxID=1742358 RepID=UPI002E24CC4F|nr:hypothetical protein [Cytobacillus praedii]